MNTKDMFGVILNHILKDYELDALATTLICKNDPLFVNRLTTDVTTVAIYILLHVGLHYPF